MNTIDKIRAAMSERDLRCLILTSPENRRYATGLETSAGVAVITPERAVFITDFRYIEVARAVCTGFEVLLRTREETFYTHILPILAGEGITAAGIEENAMTVAEHSAYLRELQAELIPAGSIMGYLRAVKEPWELELIRRAQAITDAAYAAVLPEIRAGMTERELAAELIYRMLRLGADGAAFEPIVVSGPNSALPHGKPSDRRLQAGDFVTMDFGAAVAGYCSDMTRTVAIGQVTDEMKTVYNTVLAAQEAGFRACRAGERWSDIDKAARDLITEAGYGDCFGHGLGHGLGLFIHESLDAGEEQKGLVQAGSIMTIEPGIYIEGRFGVRIEDMALFTEDGYVNLTASPKALTVVQA